MPKTDLETLLFDNIKVNNLDEVAWLNEYYSNGQKSGAPIFLSLGETWSSIPDKLLSHLSNAPKHCHGYQISSYGYPKLRQEAERFLVNEYDLGRYRYYSADTIHTGICSTGTRGTMYNYARYLKDQLAGQKSPVLITAAPGWDYSGVFSSAGYKVDFFNLDPEDGFLPSTEAILKKIISISDDANSFPVFAMNAQHNPTGINWPAGVVADIIELLIERKIPLLIDDAYFAIHHPDIQPTSALGILFEKLPSTQSEYVWAFTRSLGKQYGCNGWGVGLVMAPSQILNAILCTYQIDYHYNINAANQYALSLWINSADAYEHTKKLRSTIFENRKMFIQALQSTLRYPVGAFPLSNCTSFQLFPLPSHYENEGGAECFVRDCLDATGILYTTAWPLPYNVGGKLKNYNYARVFLATDKTKISNAIERMIEHKIVYG